MDNKVNGHGASKAEWARLDENTWRRTSPRGFVLVKRSGAVFDVWLSAVVKTDSGRLTRKGDLLQAGCPSVRKAKQAADEWVSSLDPEAVASAA